MTDQSASSASRFPILGAVAPDRSRGDRLTVVTGIIAIVLDLGLHADPTVVFIVAALAILGLAWVVGLSTERLGALTRPQVGGILNATIGTIAEGRRSWWAPSSRSSTRSG